MSIQIEQVLFDSIFIGFFIGGEWMDVEIGGIFDVQDLVIGVVICIIVDVIFFDGICVFDVVVVVQDVWVVIVLWVCSEILCWVFDFVQVYKEDFVLFMMLEMGKLFVEVCGEVVYGGEFLCWFSEEVVCISGCYGINFEGMGYMVVLQCLVGLLFFVMLWNFFFVMVICKIVLVFVVGCIVVIKFLVLMLFMIIYFMKLFEEVGFFVGVVNVVQILKFSVLLVLIIVDLWLCKLFFIGFIEVGCKFIVQVVEGVLCVLMEFGGNVLFVVFDDVDFDKVVEGVLVVKFCNIGQVCIVVNCFIVYKDVVGEFVKCVIECVNGMKIGCGMEEGVVIGLFIDEDVVVKVGEFVDDVVECGVMLFVGGKVVEGIGMFYEFIVFIDVVFGSVIFCEEIFGLVFVIVMFEIEEEVVCFVNDIEYGFVLYVFIENLQCGQWMIDGFEIGMMGFNVGVVLNVVVFFGGVKQFGVGCEGGFEGIYEYLFIKYMLILIF